MPLPQPLPRVPKAEEMVLSIQEFTTKFSATIDGIVNTATPETATFDNVIRPRVEMDQEFYGQLGMIYMLQYGSPDPATHDAFAQARKVYSEAETRWAGREDYFNLLRAVQDKNEELDPESKLLLEEMLLDAKDAGFGVLSQEQSDLYLEGRSKIKDLGSTFGRNIAQESGGLWFTLQELDGVPSDELAKWKDGTGSDPGNGDKKFVPFANGGFLAVVTYAQSVETRKRMYLGNNKKLPENGPVFEEIVKIRFSQARKLGYPSPAAFVLEKRMVRTTEWVDEFLSKLRNELVPRGKEELKVLQLRRMQDLKEQEGKETEKFPPWDQKYYHRLLQEDFKIDQARISEWFPLENTAVGMLGIFASCFGIRFDPIPSEELSPDALWHETVRIFSVWDGEEEGSEFIGYIYFDLLWREHKYRGNHNPTIETGFLKPGGTRQYPSTILQCSFPTPTPTSCALLKQPQIVTLFHEMGHGIHNLLSKTKYSRFHGVRVPRDFCEMPSTMLENFCWLPDILKRLSCHYTTLDGKYLAKWREENPGAPDPPMMIPSELVNDLTKIRYFNGGLYHLDQLATSIFDMTIHNVRTEQELADLDIQKLWYDLYEDLMGLDYSECKDGFDHVSFTHLIGGMDAGYYSYLVSTAFAQDLFQSVFAADPTNRGAWDRYRRGVLEYGGSYKGGVLKMLEVFLGRPPNPDSLIEGLAIADEKLC